MTTTTLDNSDPLVALPTDRTGEIDGHCQLVVEQMEDVNESSTPASPLEGEFSTLKASKEVVEELQLKVFANQASGHSEFFVIGLKIWLTKHYPRINILLPLHRNILGLIDFTQVMSVQGNSKNRRVHSTRELDIQYPPCLCNGFKDGTKELLEINT